MTLGDTHNSLDSSRINRIRYDTPAIGPLTLKASVAQNDYWDVAAVVDTTVMGGEFEAQAFYASDAKADDGGDGGSRYGGSFAYKFAQGTNFAFTYARGNRGEDAASFLDDPDTIYFFLGHDLGNTEVGVGYGISNDFDPFAEHFKATVFHAGVNHNFPKANMDVYAGYHLHTLDIELLDGSSGHEMDNIHIVAVGAKVQFD